MSEEILCPITTAPWLPGWPDCGQHPSYPLFWRKDSGTWWCRRGQHVVTLKVKR